MSGKQWKTWLKILTIVVVSVGIVRIFVLTTCIIPQAGMENSLYEDEGIVVNKWSYGLRLPFPSLLGYHRVLGKPVMKGDIVLFNSPLQKKSDEWYELAPLYISRCVGLPGDTLWLNEELIETRVNNRLINRKMLYAYPMNYEEDMRRILNRNGMKDNILVGYTPDSNYIRSFTPREVFVLNHAIDGRWNILPLQEAGGLAVHPYVIPRKGMNVKVEKWNVKMLCNAIRLHEQRKAFLKGDTLMVDGKACMSYRFTHNYYWMAANDPLNLHDSRLFGLVPETHLIGKASIVWLPASFDRLFTTIR